MWEKHRGETNDSIKLALDAMKMGCSLKNVDKNLAFTKKHYSVIKTEK